MSNPFGGRWFRWAQLLSTCMALVASAGCASGSYTDESLSTPTAAPSPATPQGAGAVSPVPPTVIVADALGSSVRIYATPGDVQPAIDLPNPWLLNGASRQPIPQAFLVLQTRPDGWSQVLLPERPNGSSGWIPPGSAQLLVDPYRILVSLHEHHVVVTHFGSAVYTGQAATGAPSTPTPTGLFYIRVLLHTTDPRSAYGPYAYGLSAHSEALTSFDGGDAEVGVHGNNDAAVLGTSVTHGCVRIDNAEISQLATVLPLGTPVEISA